MEKAKKIISLVLVAALLAGVCLMGGSMTTSAASTEIIDYGNLLSNGSFEQSKSMNLGFANMGIKNGQVNYVGVEAWRYRGHYYVVDGVTHTEKKILATHDYADAHSGNFALKFTNQGTGDLGECTAVIFPDSVVGDVTDYDKGHYRFSVWVKGTNTASYIEYTNAAGTRTQVDITDIKEDEWTQIVIDNITGIGTTTVTPTNEEAKVFLNLNLVVQTQDTATEILFDDAKLEEVPVVVDPNLIIDGGFETPTENPIVDNTFTNGRNQKNLRYGFTLYSWTNKGADMKRTAQKDEVYSGNYAIKVAANGTDDTWQFKQFYLSPSNFDTDRFEAGNYKLSVWVKTVNAKIELGLAGTTKTETGLTTDGWQQLTIEKVAINSVDELGLAGSSAGDDYYRYSKVYIKVFLPANSQVIFDDVKLEKIEETKEVLTNTSFEKFTCDVDVVHKPGQGQRNTVATGWYNSEHWGTAKEGDLATITHDTDAKSGNYALKFSFPQKGQEVSLITDTVNGDITKISGAYVLSFWVKGDGTTVSVRNRNTSTNKYETIKTETVTGEWTQISAVISNVNYWNAVYNNRDTDKRDTLTAEIRVAGSTEKEAYALVDDISLMPLDTIYDVKDQITGIAQPAVDAKELTLPTLDTNNDDITVSIAASSDENIIALDGTITTPKMQTVVDVTLKISDGTNTVTLEPIGVLVHGELDTVTQAVIEAAIEALNVKADSAEVDIAEIESWLRYKPTYVSTAKSNIFSQKKLVFEHDPDDDSDLDADDIEVIRTELLDTETELKIQDHVKTYKYVVQYKSYSN